MDYLAYYKLALEKVYGGEFPEMSSEEFDRRCALETVPAALKALYLALGTERICTMHTLLPMPEELFCVENMVLVQKSQDRIGAIQAKDLTEENPILQVMTEHREEADGTDIWIFANDGTTRLAVQMANLIAESARKTAELQQTVRHGFWNTVRNAFSHITRKRELLLNVLILCLLVVFIQSGISFTLVARYPKWGGLSVLFFMVLTAVPVYSIGRIYFYWNVWIHWSDNVRFTDLGDKLFLQTLEQTLQYLRWNRPDLWSAYGCGSVEFNPEVALHDGPNRFCQGRYDLISDADGALYFPGFAVIRYSAKKQCSVLLRTTLDDSGCLKFLYVNDHCNWRLPKKKRLSLRSASIVKDVLTEDLTYKIGPAEDVPENLRECLKQCCSDYPSIRKAWLNPAIMDGVPVYLLTVLGDEDTELNPLLGKALELSDRPFNAAVVFDENGMENNPPLFVRNAEEKQ